MKRLILLLTLLFNLNKTVQAQSITIEPSTPSSSCAGQNITVYFAATGLTPPYTVELVRSAYTYSQWGSGCDGTYTTVVSSVSTSGVSAVISISASDYNRTTSGYCSDRFIYTEYEYYIRVSSGSIEDEYPIHLKQTCSPTMVGSVTPETVCPGKTTTVQWNSIGAASGNVFTIDMSDQYGYFDSPVVLGTVSGNNSDGSKTFMATIPSGLPSGSGYRIRVSSANPASSANTFFTIGEASVCGPVINVSVPNTPFCQGASTTATFEHNDTFLAGNVFTAELSDENGSFYNPITIGSVTSQTATSIPITLPSNLESDNYYRIRIKASLPSSGVEFISNPYEYVKIGIYKPYISGNSSFCEHAEMNLSASTYDYSPRSAYSFVWKKDGTNVTSSNQSTQSEGSYLYYERTNSAFSDAGSYTLEVTRVADGCVSLSDVKSVSVNAAPSAPITSPLTVISGNTAILNATGCIGDVYWYNSLSSENYEYIGYNSYTTQEITQETTFYASCYTDCYSTRTPLIVSVDSTNAPQPPTIISSHNNFCSGAYSSVTLSATGCTGTVRWYYKNGNNYNHLATYESAPYDHTAYLYYGFEFAADCREEGILSTSTSKISLNILPSPSYADIIPYGTSVNSGSSLTLSVKNCSGTVKWYETGSSSTPLDTGNTYTLISLTNTEPQSYIYGELYATCTKDGCEGPKGYTNYYVYNNIVGPTITSTNEENSLCSGSSTILTAHGCSNGTVTWYDAYNGGNTLAVGQSYTTPVFNYGSNNTYSFYADCAIGSNTSSRELKSIYITNQPTTPSANQPTIPCNTSATLVAAGCNTNAPDYFEVKWYESLTATTHVHSGGTFTTPPLSQQTTYYVVCENYNCTSERIPVTVTVDCPPPNPPVISASITTFCEGIVTTLSATGCTGTVHWSDGGTGANRAGVLFTASHNLTAICTVGTLVSGNSNQVAITVNPKPTLIITNPAAVSPPNTANLTALAVTAGSTLPPSTTLTYYTNSGATSTLANPEAIAVSGTYYIKASTSAGCTDVKPVVVTINDCSTAINLVSSPTNNFSNGTHLKKSNQLITASNKISGTSKVTYRSNKSITLIPQEGEGFLVAPGAVFVAEIGGCN